MRAFLRNMIEPKRNSVASFAPRSVLFVPLHNKRALAKAPALNADAFILDLEDAVPTHAKVAARENIAEAVKQLQGRRLTIRINCPLRSPALAEEDMNAVAEVSRSLSAIVLPKVEGVANVEVIKQQLYPDLEVWANIETRRASSPRWRSPSRSSTRRSSRARTISPPSCSCPRRRKIAGT
eukprot:PhM_4_TR4208/c0_g1_i1/m.16671/K01644/citE; citrate lyase subunit beta / citryl-CoA lyase